LLDSLLQEKKYSGEGGELSYAELIGFSEACRTVLTKSSDGDITKESRACL